MSGFVDVFLQAVLFELIWAAEVLPCDIAILNITVH